MAICIVTDVFCDICSDWENGASGNRPKASEARAHLKNRGWIRRRNSAGDMIDVCPRCAATNEMGGE